MPPNLNVPTFLQLMGAPIPANLQGRSLVPVLENEATLEGNDVFIQLHSPANGELWRPCTGEEMRIVAGRPPAVKDRAIITCGSSARRGMEFWFYFIEEHTTWRVSSAGKAPRPGETDRNRRRQWSPS